MLIREGACLYAAGEGPAIYATSVLGILAGSLLLVGFLTTFASLGSGLAATLAAFKVLPGCASVGFDSRLALIFALAILSALALIGPGAYSLDGRLFGRREIIIPPPAQTGHQ